MSRTWRWRECFHLLPLWIVLAHAGSVHAQDTERIQKLLRVEAGATCLTSEQLAAEVERSLDDARIADDFVIFVEGSSSDPRSARLRVVRDTGVVAERSFEPGPARCSHLHAAIGLAIALAIKASQEQERGDTRDWSLAGSGLWTYRWLPQVAPGVELSVRRALGAHALLRIGAVGVAAFDVPLKAQAASFDATMIAVRAEGCARAKLVSALRAGACLGLLSGVLYASGNDMLNPTSSVVPWVALSGAADLELELSARWSLALGLSASVLLHRVQVGVEDENGKMVAGRTLSRPAFAIGLGPVYYF